MPASLNMQRRAWFVWATAAALSSACGGEDESTDRPDAADDMPDAGLPDRSGALDSRPDTELPDVGRADTGRSDATADASLADVFVGFEDVGPDASFSDAALDASLADAVVGFPDAALDASRPDAVVGLPDATLDASLADAVVGFPDATGLPDAGAGDAVVVLPDAGGSSDAVVSLPDAGLTDAGGSGDAGDAGLRDASSIDGGPVTTVDLNSIEFVKNGVNIDSEDEIRVACDDAVAGAAGHEPCDVGAASFTYEVWLYGDAANNTNASTVGTDVDVAAYDWIDGNIFLDRDVFGGTCDGYDFGAAIIDDRVAFGIGAVGSSGPLTIYGSTDVVETPAAWHHVALVYDDVPVGNELRIYVDGALDYTSTTTLTDVDRSIPDTGCTQGLASSAARQAEIVFGGEKHGFNGISFDGRIGRIRIWDVARTSAEISANWDQEVSCTAVGLVALYDLETGSGTVATEACGVSPDGTIDLGTRSLTSWVKDGPVIKP